MVDKISEKDVKKYLTSITMNVRAFIALLDVQMLKPADSARGNSIAELVAKLEFANDTAMRFGLGLESKGGKLRKVKR